MYVYYADASTLIESVSHKIFISSLVFCVGVNFQKAFSATPFFNLFIMFFMVFLLFTSVAFNTTSKLLIQFKSFRLSFHTIYHSQATPNNFFAALNFRKKDETLFPFLTFKLTVKLSDTKFFFRTLDVIACAWIRRREQAKSYGLVNN